MKKNYLMWLFLLMISSVASTVSSQTDLTSRFITNPGFDEQIEFTKDMEPVNLRVQGELVTHPEDIGGIREVYGWKNLVPDAEWGVTASFEYGYMGTLNGQDVAGRGAIPSAGPDGSDVGGVLGISSAWTWNVRYGQDTIFLPPGKYSIEYATYNSGPVATNNTSQVGFYRVSGSPIKSTKTNFALNTWETENIDIELTTPVSGSIQVGVSSGDNGSGNVGRIFFDYVKFYFHHVDKELLATQLADAKVLVTEIDGEPGVSELATAIPLFEPAMTREATDPELLYAAQDFVPYYIPVRYTKDLIDIINEAIDVEQYFPGGSESVKIELRLAVEAAEIAQVNQEIDTYPAHIEALRNLIEAYKASIVTGLRVHYDFSEVNDRVVTDVTGSGFDGTLVNEADVITMGKYKVLSLGNGTGYLDMGATVGGVAASMDEFTVSVYYRVNETADLTGDGRFLWSFASSDATTQTQGEYIAYRLNAQLYELSPAGWGSGRNFTVQRDGAAAGQATKGEWQHILYRQVDRNGELFLNGEKVGSLDTLYLRSEVVKIPTLYNWIGRAPFAADRYLQNTLVYDFRLYNEAITDAEIAEFAALVPELDYEYIAGGGGDFTELIASIDRSREFSNAMVIGDGFGEYPQLAKDTLDKIIVESQLMVDEGIATQFLIDPQVAKMDNVFTYATRQKNAVMSYPQGNTPESQYPFESGLYYIQVGDYFLTLPESGTGNTPLKLQPYTGNLDKENNNQVWRVEFNRPYSRLSEEEDDPTGVNDIRALFSFVSSKGVWDADEPEIGESGETIEYWHMDEWGRMKTGGTAVAQSFDGGNWTWREHMIYYGGDTDADNNRLYSIVNHNQNCAIFFETIAADVNATYAIGSKVFQFRFRTIDDVVDELGSSISENESSNVNVYGTQGEIVASGINAGDMITVYDFGGRVTYSGKATSDQSHIAINKGFYIVKVADYVTKVVVK